jgi:F-type H+-transporting ATPase subunit b
LEALGISLGYLLAFALSFGILFVVLRAWVFVPLLNQLERRRTTIARGLEDARVAADARANAEKEANRIISDAQTRASQVMREATERAGKVEGEIRAQADAETARAREVAMAGLENERNMMLSELRGQIASLAISAARKLVSDNLDEQRQRSLVNEFFSGLRNGQVTLLDGNTLQPGEVVDVTSALPLTPAEEETIRSEFSRKIGASNQVRFRVDPEILGGLIVRVGDQVVDGSVSGRLEELRFSLR